MYLSLFLYIAAFFSLTLGEFGQMPFGKTDFSVSVSDILLTLGLIALLVWNIGINKNLQFPKAFSYLIIFWAICIFSLFLSLELSGWFYLLRFIIYSSTFYFTYHLIKSKILGLKEFLTLLKISGLALAIFGFIFLAIFPDLKLLSLIGYDPHISRLVSTFLDPNFMGTFLIFSFVMITWELVNKKDLSIYAYLKSNIWNLLAVLVLGAAIIFTFSRSSYLMLIISTLILFAKNKKLLLSFAIFLVILYFSFGAFNQRINGAISIDASSSERFLSWDKGLIIFQQNPIFGVGFNNIRNYSQEKNLLQIFSADGGNSGSGIDSSLIFVMATTGLLGFVCFSLLLFKILSGLIFSVTNRIKTFYNLQFQHFRFLQKIFILPKLGRWYREATVEKKAQKNNNLSLPLLSLFLGLLANSFFINSLFYPPILFLLFSLIGVFYGVEEGDGDGS